MRRMIRPIPHSSHGPSGRRTSLRRPGFVGPRSDAKNAAAEHGAAPTNTFGGTTVKHRTSIIVIAIAFAILASTAHAGEFATKKVPNLSVSKEIVAAAEVYAVEKGWNVVIAVVDDGGHLIYLQRMDGAQVGSIEVADRKAKSAAYFKRPTKVFDDAVAGGKTALVVLPGSLPFDGGLPITVGDQIIGAIGVSGVTGAQDAEIAQAGLDALAKMLEK